MSSIESNAEHLEPMIIKYHSVLSTEQFNEFYAFINIIKPYFEDFCLVDGIFNMRTDDLTGIVKTEFQYLKGASLNIANTKLFAKMLSTLNKKGNISLSIEDYNVNFTDGSQNISLQNKNFQFIDGGYNTGETLEEIIHENTKSSKLFYKGTFRKSAISNVKKIIRELKTHKINIIHELDNLNNGYLLITDVKNYYSELGNRPEYRIKLENGFLIPIEKNFLFTVTNIPFIFDENDLIINYYLNEENIIVTIYKTKIGGLIVYLYGRTALILDE